MSQRGVQGPWADSFADSGGKRRLRLSPRPSLPRPFEAVVRASFAACSAVLTASIQVFDRRNAHQTAMPR